MTRPLTSLLSATDPPSLATTRTASSRTSRRPRSATSSTACTHISDSRLASCLTTLEDRAVSHTRCSSIRPVRTSKGAATRSSSDTATSAAASYPADMRMGWTPMSIIASASPSSAPASTTTPVVPSPTSSSWEMARETISAATSFWTSTRSRISRPSFVIVTSPPGDCIILSMPVGPREVERTRETARAAEMLRLVASAPCTRSLWGDSRSMMYGRPYSSKASDIAPTAPAHGTTPTALAVCPCPPLLGCALSPALVAACGLIRKRRPAILSSPPPRRCACPPRRRAGARP
mmetsp:Transcript_23360/g.79469  ORF Transcript_23360/g.79469 Transcript_23360/m.79469 type:complete len:292 (-) Transcript_23360:602-1477(-)